MIKIPVKNIRYETVYFNKRLWKLIGLISIPLICILLRLVDLQIIHHRQYATMSTKNLLGIVPIPPARGAIYDRNHLLLAQNVVSYNLNIVPEKAGAIKNTVSYLQSIIHFNQQDIDDFNARIRQHRPYQSVPLAFNLTPSQIAQIYVSSYRLPGVVIAPDLHRYYPLGEITAPVIGYIGHINPTELAQVQSSNYSATTFIGKSGIEKNYEAQLHGHTGAKQIEIDVTGHTVKSLQTTAATAGNNLTLTLDARLQKVAMQALGDHRGAVVALSTQNGEVLVLASKPSYPPNLLVQGLAAKTYHHLFSSGKYTLFNKATQGLYSVASTIKPFLAVGALGLNIIKPHSTIFDPGWFKIKNTKHIYHDWKLGGHGSVDVTRAIMVSCDTFFYHLSMLLGINRLSHILYAFGFGSKTGIDLPHEKIGIVPTPAWKKTHLNQPWYMGDTVETAIGQEYQLATPLQLARATAQLANQGRSVHPHLLLQQTAHHPTHNTDPTSNQQIALVRPDPTDLMSIISKKDWHTIRHAMVQVIQNPYGTGLHFGRHPRYSVAAKTGTAQLFGHQRDEESTQANLPVKLRNNHLFIAYAPVIHPQIAIAVVVEHHAFAAIIARRVLDYYFLSEQHLNASKKTRK